MPRTLSFTDRLIGQFDNALRTLTPGATMARTANPADAVAHSDLSDTQRRHSEGLMRINHSGEVCAQGLYQGQALTAGLPTVRASMMLAAEEELDHLAWCDQRLQELQGTTSWMNPLFFTLSYGLGAVAGAAGDRYSLGFVAATEDQVSHHLSAHLQQIDQIDGRSTAILKQMLADERRHEESALAAGGIEFAPPVKHLMTVVSKLMTKVAYYV
ncbi:2-polyprenyl-3-methyl-6-methoxy-1,4-benzoquinone monooxygenase [Reinekea sp.]|jgi:ubiquinone biosynthesis monooxygenase Coq7|uniref:2-polyprenyl-3-methyl-6-methoxy-1,4-benzoquinone monooxygenase n=1 Tax=Reinekea sp. TaxID=1970455 RepID=UPI002A821323|nr:2-polyprenyl-3-methyl-6-methoxy-1,4-benzoquinone monooxygenase [Reinekea sp.]